MYASVVSIDLITEVGEFGALSLITILRERLILSDCSLQILLVSSGTLSTRASLYVFGPAAWI